MPAGSSSRSSIPLYFEGHAYRAGSRIRVTIAAPNGTQPIWSFGQTQPEGTTATESIAFSPSMPSSLILPIVPGVSVPTGLPAVPEPAQRALPAVPGDREQRVLTARRLRNHVEPAWGAVGPTLPATMISAYERDQRQPSLETLLKLLHAAGFELRLNLEPLDPHDDTLETLEERRSPAERRRRDRQIEAWRRAQPVAEVS